MKGIFEATNLSKLSIYSTGCGSDAAYTTQLCIPTLDSMGVECENIHSKNECATISSLKEVAKRKAAITLASRLYSLYSKDVEFCERRKQICLTGK